MIRAANTLGIATRSISSLRDQANVLIISLEYRAGSSSPEVRRARTLQHPLLAALPAYRGVFTSIWPILNGETQAGVTLHEIDNGIDTGPIVDQRLFSLPPSLTARRLYDLFMDEAFELFKGNLVRLIQGDVKAVPQDNDRASYYGRSEHQLRGDRHRSGPTSGVDLPPRSGVPFSRVPVAATGWATRCGLSRHSRDLPLAPGTQVVLDERQWKFRRW